MDTGESPTWKCHPPYIKDEGEEIVYSRLKAIEVSRKRGYKGLILILHQKTVLEFMNI
jgi:hypothetical protein